MSNYIPSEANNVTLNFKDELVTPNPRNVILTFGLDTLNLAQVDATICTAYLAEIEAESRLNNEVDAVINTGFSSGIAVITGQAAQVDTVLATQFIAEITAVGIDQFCAVDVTMNIGFISTTNADLDLNNLGLFCRLTAGYEQPNPCMMVPDIPFAKPIFKALNSAFFYEHGLTISSHASISFDKAKPLYRAVQTVFEQATGLSRDWRLIWQENLRLFISRSILFNESEKLRINRETTWQEMIRKRKQITYTHEVAHVFEKRFWLSWDKGLEITLNSDIPWEKAQSIHYRKHAIEPWPSRPQPEYIGNPNLNFICLCHDVDPYNVILNFGADDCIPSIPNRNWWYIVNEISVTRLDNGQVIQVLNGSYRTDRNSWCWTYNLVIPYFELSKLDPIDNKPVILKIAVNGYQHLMLLENRTRSRRFAQDTYTLTGRSVSALLDSPSSPPRAFLQENERTSVQLAQAEIDRSAYPDLGLNWQLIDALGWIVPTESFSYSGLTPIKAIQEIASAGGGFIYSEADSQSISIKPLYKKTFWNLLAISEYDILLPESIVTEQSTDYENYPDYNGITLTNDKTGLTGQVKRIGTSGDVIFETTNNNLFTDHVVMGGYGKSKLAKAGLVESHSFTMPLTSEIGQCKPADILAFNADWWGVVDAVSVSFTYSKVTQTVTVERVNHG